MSIAWYKLFLLINYHCTLISTYLSMAHLCMFVEHLPRTQNVAGSSPAWGSSFFLWKMTVLGELHCVVLYCFGSLLVWIFHVHTYNMTCAWGGVQCTNVLYIIPFSSFLFNRFVWVQPDCKKLRSWLMVMRPHPPPSGTCGQWSLEVERGERRRGKGVSHHRNTMSCGRVLPLWRRAD